MAERAAIKRPDQKSQKGRWKGMDADQDFSDDQVRLLQGPPWHPDCILVLAADRTEALQLCTYSCCCTLNLPARSSTKRVWAV